LSQLAYSECSQAIQDKIACAQFVSALSERFVSRTLQLEGVTSLRIAIEIVKTIRLMQESGFGQRKRTVNVEGRGENRNNNNFNSNQDVRNCNKNFGSNFKGKERKFNKNKFEEKKNNKKKRNENRKEYWECGQEGHFQSV